MGLFSAFRPRTKDSLIAAVVRRDVKSARDLLSHGGSASAKDSDGAPALLIAGSNSDIGMIELLIKHGADINAVQENWTILMHLTLNHRANAVEALLMAGAKPNLSDHLGTTPLMVAALEGADDIALSLIQFGADVTARDNSGKTALRNAQMTGSPTMKRLLQQAGAED